MEQIQIIREQEVLGKNFKVYGDFTNPLFVAKDVAEWLDYDVNQVGKMLASVDNDEKLTVTILRGGQNREVWALTENGLYEVLMLSRKPIAKIFKKQVKGILSELRRTGMVTAQYGNFQVPTTLSGALRLAAEQAETIEFQQKQIEKQSGMLEAHGKEIKRLLPGATFAKAVETSDRSVLIGELAKIIKQNGVEIGQNRLFSWLRENGFLCKSGESYNQPTQKGMNLGLFEMKKTVITKPNGDSIVTTTSKVTGKGQIYFVNRFLYDLANENVKGGTK